MLICSQIRSHSQQSLDEISMDYSHYAQFRPPPQQPQPPPPNPGPFYLYYTILPQPQNPNPQAVESSSAAASLKPPGLESYASYAYEHVTYVVQPSVTFDPSQTVDAAAYNSDPNALNWSLREAVQQFGSDPAAYLETGVAVASNRTAQLAMSNLTTTVQTKPKPKFHGNSSWRKHLNKTKIVGLAYCEICKVDCSSKEVLDQHKSGKKHKKNLEKLQQPTATISSAATGSSNPVIGPPENPNKATTAGGKKNRRKAAQSVEDLEIKRRKVVEGGAAVEAVRTCTICNVVCNSETVFNYHIAGQKHAAMLKKHAAATGVPTIV